MNKSQLIAEIAQEADVTQASARHILDAITDTITTRLKASDPVSLVGFGIFSVNKRAARTGRNPRTGELINISARNVPKFAAGTTLKDSVQ